MKFAVHCILALFPFYTGSQQRIGHCGVSCKKADVFHSQYTLMWKCFSLTWRVQETKTDSWIFDLVTNRLLHKSTYLVSGSQMFPSSSCWCLGSYFSYAQPFSSHRLCSGYLSPICSTSYHTGGVKEVYNHLFQIFFGLLAEVTDQEATRPHVKSPESVVFTCGMGRTLLGSVSLFDWAGKPQSLISTHSWITE